MTGDHTVAGAAGIPSARGGAAAAAGAGRARSVTSPSTPPETYRVMFELSPDAILLADVTGRYVDTNTKALALLGYSREELLRLSARDIVAASPGWVEAEFERFVRDGHWEGEVEMRARNGTLVPLEARAVVLPGANGPLYVSYLRDRSADKHNELTRARLAAIVRSSADAIVGETAEGIITDWNPAAERLYGYAADEAIGQSLTLLAPPERRAEVEALLARVVGGESIEHLETVRRTRSGRLLPVALTLSPVRASPGRERGPLPHRVRQRSHWHGGDGRRWPAAAGQSRYVRDPWLFRA
jgi:PAS domain S-box-containing protein